MNRQRAYSVRRLAEAHRPLLTAFLRRDVANNQFLVDKVAACGVSGSRIAFWGAFEEQRMAGVAMLLDTSASAYTSEIDCLAGLVPFISGAENLSGQLTVMNAVLALIPAARLVWRQVDWLCWLPAEYFRSAPQMGARPATPEDLAGLSALYAQSEAFSRRSATEVEDHVRRQLTSCQFFLVPTADHIASAAGVVAESADSAMIVSVFTAPEYRSRGMASAVVSAACASLLARGRRPRLLYRAENDSAGRVYARLGFQKTGQWLLARLTPSDPSKVRPAPEESD